MNFSLTFSASSSDLDKDQGSYTLKCWGCVSTCTWAISYNSNSSSAGIASLGLRVWPAVNRETPFIWLTEEISRQSRMKCNTVLYISMIQVWMSYNLGTKIYTIYAEQAPLISGDRWNGYDQEKWTPTSWNADNSLSSVGVICMLVPAPGKIVNVHLGCSTLRMTDFR